MKNLLCKRKMVYLEFSLLEIPLLLEWFPYKDNFITLLQESLKEKNPSLEILNMGIPGTSVKEYLSLFVDEGLELNPDMLLLNVYIGNDILETEKKEESNLYTVRFFKYVNAVFKIENRVGASLL
jgi:hypothetical protein